MEGAKSSASSARIRYSFLRSCSGSPPLPFFETLVLQFRFCKFLFGPETEEFLCLFLHVMWSVSKSHLPSLLLFLVQGMGFNVALCGMLLM
jgi:hypothetical protein